MPVSEGGCATGDGGDAGRAPKRVLFVDDEVEVLDGLRDALRRYRRAWKMRFVSGGATAIAALEAEPADVIVSDIQMPGMDGAELLALVQERYPATIRIVLSGYANTASITRAATVAHRILAKPCNVDDLGLVIERSCALHELIQRAEQFGVAAGATTLPSCPGLYMEITRLLAKPGSGPEDIAEEAQRVLAAGSAGATAG
jgi:DNA-binding NtrC family response regulator